MANLMSTDHRSVLAKIKRFDQLVAYLRDEMGWPIAKDSFVDVDNLFYDFTADELGIDPKTAAKIESIKRLRPLSPHQPWGIFFVKFEPKKLPIIALRRILSHVALKKRASANSPDRTAWAADDLLFVSNFGEGAERTITFAHFSQDGTKQDLPVLKVLGWNDGDTALHLDGVASDLTSKLAWPLDEGDLQAWRKQWRSAFILHHREVITTARDLSIRLAELARAIRDRIVRALAIESATGSLTTLMKAFQQSLIHDLDADGFADMYAQTIAYGLLSARVTNPKANTADGFAAQLPVTNPFLKELMETFLRVAGRKGTASSGPGIDFDELGVSEVVELLDAANMEAVVRDFGDRKPEEDPVIHFYEGFAKEYDPIDRIRRGEFYTPRPVVSYIVRSAHELLRTEFGLADGLADTTSWERVSKRTGIKIPDGVDPEEAFVQILDPATGTGTFLVEVVDLIYRTVAEKWRARGERDIEVLWNKYVTKDLLPRLHGYELKMAPYAIAHLKFGLKLHETGYRFESNERARIFLTNALEPAHDFSETLAFAIPALAHEAEAVNAVKRRHRFTVVLGNPPYSNFGQLNKIPFILKLLEDYKRGLGERKINLDDDFLKFLRLAQWHISEAGAGILGFITNNAYVDGVTHRRMRESLLESFQKLFILNLHGSITKKEKAPDGSKDENVFDIQQGVGIGLGVRAARPQESTTVYYSDLWGSRSSKYAELSKGDVANTKWETVEAKSPSFLFVPTSGLHESEWSSMAPVTSLFEAHCEGAMTSRDAFAIAFDRDELIARLEDFRNLRLNSDEIRERYNIEDTRDWTVEGGRKELARDEHWKERIVQILHCPFDQRWGHHSKSVMDWPRLAVLDQMRDGNLALLTTRQTKDDFGALATDLVARHKAASRYDKTFVFPLYLDPGDQKGLAGTVLATKAGRRLNLSPKIVGEMEQCLGMSFSADPEEGENEVFGPLDCFNYVYGILNSLGYRRRYSEFLKKEFPRIPFAKHRGLFRAVADLGAELVAVHLMKSPKLDQSVTTYSGPKNPRVGRVEWSEDTVWIDRPAAKKGERSKPASGCIHGVSEAVWKFQVGGYQVCEKWLTERKERELSSDEVVRYGRIVGAIDETIRLMGDVDDVIEAHGGWPRAFESVAAEKKAVAVVLPFRPRIVRPLPDEQYVACVPLLPLKAAAGAFSQPQNVDAGRPDDETEWVSVETRHRLRPGMFVAQVVGRSMEPLIPDGSYCLFAAPVSGSRHGKTVLVQLQDAADPETGQRFTVKRYESEKTGEGDSWRHSKIILKPINPDFKPIVLTGADDGQLQVLAEFLEVVG